MRCEDVIYLDPKSWDEFVRVMNTPAEPTPAAMAAAKLHRELRVTKRREGDPQ